MLTWLSNFVLYVRTGHHPKRLPYPPEFYRWAFGSEPSIPTQQMLVDWNQRNGDIFELKHYHAIHDSMLIIYGIWLMQRHCMGKYLENI